MHSLRRHDVLQLEILQANVGNYDASARYYVRALSLNPQAVNVWGYLRTSLACSGKVELMLDVGPAALANGAAHRVM